MLSDGLIEGERAPGDVIAPAADDDAADVTVAQGASRATLTMSRVDPILPSALQDRMGRHETAAVEDADDVGKLMHLDDASGPIGNAVVVGANRDEPVMADAPFELEECVEGGVAGNGWRSGFSAAKASDTIRCVVPCRRTLATVSSQSASWPLRSSRLRNERPRKKSWRM